MMSHSATAMPKSKALRLALCLLLCCSSMFDWPASAQLTDQQAGASSAGLATPVPALTVPEDSGLDEPLVEDSPSNLTWWQQAAAANTSSSNDDRGIEINSSIMILGKFDWATFEDGSGRITSRCIQMVSQLK